MEGHDHQHRGATQSVETGHVANPRMRFRDAGFSHGDRCYRSVSIPLTVRPPSGQRMAPRWTTYHSPRHEMSDVTGRSCSLPSGSR